LCNYLLQHPSVFISKKKEPNFFLYDSGEDIDREKTNDVVTLEQYHYWFRNATHFKAIGEGSVGYLSDEKAPYRIREIVPDVKLIMILRHPVERAYSHYLFNQRLDAEAASEFLTAFQNDRTRKKSHHKYFERGLYHHYLKHYYEVFPKDRIKIYLFDDFKKNPQAVVRDVFKFLGVAEEFEADVRAKDAVSGVPRNKAIYDFIHGDNQLRKLLRPIFRLFLSPQQRRLLWTKAIEASLKKPGLDREVKQMLQEEYRSDILQLQDLIEQDLSHWLA